ncbi:MAG: hypothetical protein ACI4Q4_07880, partial [Oscillospiraceae bacterium]
ESLQCYSVQKELLLSAFCLRKYFPQGCRKLRLVGKYRENSRLSDNNLGLLLQMHSPTTE